VLQKEQAIEKKQPGILVAATGVVPANRKRANVSHTQQNAINRQI